MNLLPTPKYKYIKNELEARTAISEISNYPEFQVDTEGTSLDPYECKTTLLQIGTGDNVYVFDTRSDLPDVSIHGSLFKDLLTDKTKLKLLQNANYDMKVLKVQYGYYLNNIYDTFLAERIINLGRPYIRAGLKHLVKRYLGFDMPKEARSTFSNYYQEFSEEQLNYAAGDVYALDTIRDQQVFKINEFNLNHVLNLEFDFLKPLCEMELNGIKLDVKRWNKILDEMHRTRDTLYPIISSELQKANPQTTLFDVPVININSQQQLLQGLHRLGIAVPDTTKETLGDFKEHAIVNDLLDYRQAEKFVSTYGEEMLSKVSKYTNRLHTSFNQMVETGRMSSRHPNLQNIPGKQKYRAPFIAEDGNVLITADGSGYELRILGNMSQDKEFIKAYTSGIDLHTLNASNIFNVSYEAVQNDQKNGWRKASKAISFGLCVPESTKTFTSNGIKAIKDVHIDEHIAHDVGNDLVIDKKFTGIKECFNVTTKYGYSVESTADHKFMVIDGRGEYVEKQLKEINKDIDYICIKKGSNIFNKKIYKFKHFDINKNTNYKHFKLPSTLDKDFAAFLGLFISEGSIQKVKGRDNFSFFSVCLSGNVDYYEFVHNTFYLLKRLFGDRLTVTPISLNRYQFALNSVLFCEFTMSLFNGMVIKNKEIHIPDCIQESPKDIQAEFLKWLFEGDGTHKYISNNCCRIEYSSKSNKLVEDLQLMLLNFGILSSINYEYRKGRGEEKYYVLSIVGRESYDLYMKHIGFVSNYKKYRCIYNTFLYKSCYYLPSQSLLLDKLFCNYTSEKEKNTYIYDVMYNCKNNTKNKIGNELFKKLARYDDSGFLSFVDSNGIVPLKIKSIKSTGSKPVYDISVENRELFLANGFVAHNCYGLSYIGLARRLKIPENKAKDMIDKYFKVNYGVKRWLDSAKKKAVQLGYSESISGRKRFYDVPGYDNENRKNIIGAIERQGMNAPIQGSNADCIKRAMVLCVDNLEKYGDNAKLILTVHDEIIIECKEELKYEVNKIVENSIIDSFAEYFTTIPMETEGIISTCWMKGACVDEKRCGHNEMKFVQGGKYGTKLVCKKCGKEQE